MTDEKHSKQRQGDEYFCHKCGCRWDKDEDPPPKCVIINS